MMSHKRQNSACLVQFDQRAIQTCPTRVWTECTHGQSLVFYGCQNNKHESIINTIEIKERNKQDEVVPFMEDLCFLHHYMPR